MTDRTLHLGFDDTDSTRKGCTTYVASLLVEKLLDMKATFIDYPNLIRLNPNVPWKTRGNGALCLRIRYPESIEEELKENVIETVQENSDLESRQTDPGIVFFKGRSIPEDIQYFAASATVDIVTLQVALKLLKKHRAEGIGFKNGRGIIGATAAIGNLLSTDHTFEALAYRTSENFGSKRKVDEKSVFRMNNRTKPFTFNNVDEEKRRVIITPRGPDPILFGVRGETPDIVKQALIMIQTDEPVGRWMICRSNQGTDAHLKQVRRLDRLEPYSSVVARGTVASNPRVIRGRHVLFSVNDETAEVDCAAYEPTGALNRIARELIPGDSVEVYGAVKVRPQEHPVTINLEKIRILKLAVRCICMNPVCPNCGKRLKSMGRAQGFRCERCGSRYGKIGKMMIDVPRGVKSGLYIASTRSQRHLTKPLIRYGQEKNSAQLGIMIEKWHFP
jgi:tRNA(Ile2)-agmatinylcytidine synthase